MDFLWKGKMGVGGGGTVMFTYRNASKKKKRSSKVFSSFTLISCCGFGHMIQLLTAWMSCCMLTYVVEILHLMASFFLVPRLQPPCSS